jgi:hypothetical protein
MRPGKGSQWKWPPTRSGSPSIFRVASCMRSRSGFSRSMSAATSSTAAPIRRSKFQLITFNAMTFQVDLRARRTVRRMHYLQEYDPLLLSAYQRRHRRRLLQHLGSAIMVSTPLLTRGPYSVKATRSLRSLPQHIRFGSKADIVEVVRERLLLTRNRRQTEATSVKIAKRRLSP